LYPYSPYSSSELCRFIEASERTLQYVVSDYTQLTPNQYAKALKLNMVKHHQQKGDPEKMKIVQLALDLGFWHSAQFAADYKRQFGELPSQTLKKRTQVAVS